MIVQLLVWQCIHRVPGEQHGRPISGTGRLTNVREVNCCLYPIASHPKLSVIQAL